MFRPMRRIRQLLSPEDTSAVMHRCTNGVLACLGDAGWPYAVPLSYAYYNGKIYFHAAAEGHKADAMAREPRVSFAVVDEDTIVGKEYTTYFRSVIAFGTARIVAGEEWQAAFRAMVDKYSADQPVEQRHRQADGCTQAVIYAIDVEHITGKEAIEYVNANK